MKRKDFNWIHLNEEQYSFLIEALKWGKFFYEERCARSDYLSIDGYREKEYLPKIKLYDSVLKAILEARPDKEKK